MFDFGGKIEHSISRENALLNFFIVALQNHIFVILAGKVKFLISFTSFVILSLLKDKSTFVGKLILDIYFLI